MRSYGSNFNLKAWNVKDFIIRLRISKERLGFIVESGLWVIMKAIWAAKRFARYRTSLHSRSNSKKIKRLKIHRWLLNNSSLTLALLLNVLKMTFMRIQKWLFRVHLMATMFVFLPMGRQALVRPIRWAGLRLSRVLW